MSKLSRLSTTLKNNWRKGEDTSLSEPLALGGRELRPWPDMSVFPEESVSKRWYSWNKKQWIGSQVVVRLDPQKFAEGSMRVAHYVTELQPDGAERRCVAKRMKAQSKQGVGMYENDVMTQAACQAIARAYNLRKPAKPVQFLDAFLIQQDDGTLWHVETYLPGKFVKHNNNWGIVAGARNTPQAFSHFSYEFSQGRLVVVDIQGVDDFYTDPQIHTTDKQGFGIGNMGQPGIDRFLRTHHCSELCTNLGLTFMAPKILGIIPRQPRTTGTIQVAENITLEDDHLKVSEFLGQMAPRKDSARPEELTLLRMSNAQFNRLAGEFRKADKDKTGFLEEREVVAIYHALNDPAFRTREEDFPPFAKRLHELLDQEGMVDFRSFLLCWTANL
jgi:hypothetical protein